MDEKDKKISKLQGVIITLCTVIVGLSSYIFYLSSQINNENTTQRCEYNGWAYADGESFPSSDGCNTCSCSNGDVVCTEMACINSPANSSPACESGETCSE